jgi:hypothetical protein
MPLTCSHPAAVLPFARYKTLNFTALVIGSMSPDFGYFIGQRQLAKIAHHPIGTVAIDVPAGLIALGLFYILRRDLCYLLPAPHRNQLTPLTERKPQLSAAAFIIVTWSLLLGSWTHVIWDQFTHDGTYGARHFAPLRFTLFHMGLQDITVAYSLQYISTFVGGAVLAIAYWKWLRSQPARPDGQADSWRYVLIFFLGLVSLSIGLLLASHLSGPIRDFTTFREFVYDMGVSAVSIYFLLIVTAAVLCFRRKLTTATL